MTVRLVDEQPCPTCGGRRTVTEESVIRDAVTGSVIMGVSHQKCSACGGTGVRVSPVSCAGCRWWGKIKPKRGATDLNIGICRCYKDSPGARVNGTNALKSWGDHGCTDWTAKEGTDGR